MAVLVLDGNARSALAVTRSLGSRGVTVHVAEAMPTSLAGASRYSAGHHVLPSPIDAPQAYAPAVLDLAVQIGAEVVFPMTDVSSVLLADLEARTARPMIAMPPAAAYHALSDKAELLRRAATLGIVAPATEVVSDRAGLAAAASRLGYPCVLKPARSRLRLGTRVIGTAVHTARSAADLETVAASPWFGAIPCLVQEFIPGTGAGVFCLCGADGPVAWFAHRRLREKPPAGGVSVLSESVPVDPGLRECSERLLADAGWFGPAMVEFRVDPAGRPWLMEVNARFWGSLQLAIDCGVDFPWLLYQLCRGEAAAGPAVYPVGRQLRWLLGDFDHLLLQLRGKGTAITAAAKLKAIARFLQFGDSNRRLEILRRDDPAPFRHELHAWIRALRG